MNNRRRSQRRPRRPESRFRRDPRQERLYQGEVAAPEPVSASGRRRRDPHAGRQVQPGSRLRIDRSQPVTAALSPAPAPAPLPVTSGPQRRSVIIEQPAYWVLAVPDLDEAGRLTAHDRDVFGAARQLADAGQGAVIALTFGARDDLALAGADRLLDFADPVFQGYAPEARVQALAVVLESVKPRHVVLPDTPTGGGDLGRRLAALRGDMVAAQVQKIERQQVISRGNGGRSDFLREPPLVMLLAPEAADPVTTTVHEARPLPAPPLEIAARLRYLGPVAVDPNAVPLPEADFIVSAGNGVTDWPAFHAVAAALGATEGGSRVVCDAGLLPRNRQVGASGTLVEPRCYLAFGIAGAPQHLQGITRCERVLAVNTDLHADMIKRADLAIVADAQQVMPALTRLVQEKRHES